MGCVTVAFSEATRYRVEGVRMLSIPQRTNRAGDNSGKVGKDCGPSEKAAWLLWKDSAIGRVPAC